MDCSEKEKVCSVKKENESGYYRLHTIWNPDGFLLNVTSKNGAWRGEMSKDEMKTTSNQLNLNLDEYLKQCKEALTTHEGQNGMVYAVENGNFTWKKLVDEDSGIKIKMGSVKLVPANFVDTIQDLLGVALRCNDRLQKELNELQREKDKIVNEKKELVEKLEEIVKLKNDMETDLYGRFLLLLNSKKKKIMELEKILDGKEKSHGSEIDSNKIQIDNEKFYEADTDNDDHESEFDALESPKPSRSNLMHSCDARNSGYGSQSEKSPGGKRLKKSERSAEDQEEISENKNEISVNKIHKPDAGSDDLEFECEVSEMSKSLNETSIPSPDHKNKVITDEKRLDGKKSKEIETDSGNVNNDKSDLSSQENKLSKVDNSSANIPSTSGIPLTKEELLAYFYGP